jgi:hypothetical protein
MAVARPDLPRTSSRDRFSLRHHAAAGRDESASSKNPNPRPIRMILGNARGEPSTAIPRAEAHREVAIGRRVHAVGHHSAEAQPVGEEVRVDGQPVRRWRLIRAQRIRTARRLRRLHRCSAAA